MASLLSATLNITSRLAPGLAGPRAFALFVKPLGRARLRPEEAEVMARAESGRMVVHGTAVTTYRWGGGDRPVLIVHGWSSRASRFAGFVEALRAQGRTVIAFDAPGHGESDGRFSTVLDYRAIIGRLHAEHGDFSAVVAHSFGVVATFSMLNDGIPADRVIGIGGVAHFDYLVERFRAGLNLGEGVGRVLRTHVERRLFPGDPDIWQRLDARRRLPGTRAPILLFHDTEDDVIDLAQSRAIAAAYGPQARLVETTGLGHRRILSDPDVIATTVDFALSEPEPKPEPEPATATVRCA
ncbi:alpha/beta hydrolase [Streptomyces sp. NRRL S-237]|uniref:alpha/beta hydrolase n=1 Tax=Streptomyces sp. NRRL S-237 TaxID=1463895 RepID=UPI0006897C95|nr:alpha/beta fold hydrolase [Streptomyces sp. NRRL S-237]